MGSLDASFPSRLVLLTPFADRQRSLSSVDGCPSPEKAKWF
jgi:hypothetical protein